MLCVGGGQVLASSAFAAPVPTCTPSAGFTNCQLFLGTGARQTFTVPTGVTSIRADLQGSGGGAGNYDPAEYSGTGGATSGTVQVTAGQQLDVTVGTPSFGGGGAAGTGGRGSGGHGGGLSALWSGFEFESDPLVIAGGGGGQSAAGQNGQNGGAGGGSTGGDGSARDGEATGGGGATQSSAGVAGSGGTAGTGYFGGTGGTGAGEGDGGGGGGGGWRGGGGGGGQTDPNANNNDGGGGGGSGYIGGTGVTAATTTAGAGAAANTNGQVLIQWSTATVQPTPPTEPIPPTGPTAPTAPTTPTGPTTPTTHATLQAPKGAVLRSVVSTTCSLGSADVGSCLVIAYVRVNGHDVAVGRGTAVRAAGQQAAALDVTVVLSAQGKKLAARPGGAYLRLRAEMRQTGSQSVYTASSSARVIAAHVDLKPVLFAFDSAKITPHYASYLKQVRQQMGTVAAISCTGHTDYAGNNAHEKKLSLQRAKAVCALLVHGSMRVEIHAKGVGGKHPVTMQGPAKSRKANRYARVTLTY